MADISVPCGHNGLNMAEGEATELKSKDLVMTDNDMFSYRVNKIIIYLHSY